MTTVKPSFGYVYIYLTKDFVKPGRTRRNAKTRWKEIRNECNRDGMSGEHIHSEFFLVWNDIEEEKELIKCFEQFRKIDNTREYFDHGENIKKAKDIFNKFKDDRYTKKPKVNGKIKEALTEIKGEKEDATIYRFVLDNNTEIYTDMYIPLVVGDKLHDVDYCNCSNHNILYWYPDVTLLTEKEVIRKNLEEDIDDLAPLYEWYIDDKYEIYEAMDKYYINNELRTRDLTMDSLVNNVSEDEKSKKKLFKFWREVHVKRLVTLSTQGTGTGFILSRCHFDNGEYEKFSIINNLLTCDSSSIKEKTKELTRRYDLFPSSFLNLLHKKCKKFNLHIEVKKDIYRTFCYFYIFFETVIKKIYTLKEKSLKYGLYNEFTTYGECNTCVKF